MRGISYIIVNYNSYDFLRDCVASIFEFNDTSYFEIIIVDNLSTDNKTLDYLNRIKNKSKIKVIFSDTNDGFGTANNKGVNHALYDYLLLINSDCKFDCSISEKILSDYETLEKKSKVAFYSVSLKDSENVLQPSAQYFGNYFHDIISVFNIGHVISNIYWFKKLLKKLFKNDKMISGYLKSTENQSGYINCDWVSGAFMLINKSVFNLLGGFDENIFLYSEDYDICKRARDIGYSNLLNTNYAVFHYGGASTGLGKKSINFRSLYFKNYSFLYTRKKYGINVIVLRILFFLKYTILSVSNIFRLSFKYTTEYLKLGLNILFARLKRKDF